MAGGLRPASDLDLLAVVTHPLSDETRRTLMDALLDVSAPPGDPDMRALEVTCVVERDIHPWRHPARRELQFGEWLRADLEAGIVAPPVEDPDLALLLTQARAHGLALLGDAPGRLLPTVPRSDVRAAILSMRSEVARNLVGEEVHALLTLARMWVTLESGEIVAKDVAADRVMTRLAEDRRAPLRRARDIYLGRCPNDWRGWAARVSACAEAMCAAMPSS
ncbi:aminoglycoside adenylyltransferase family protein [Luteimonas sp. S4-F44]|uniref:aminoglycoside adenylyltransferase family protein n=1 Tax=Luteimonas sp. S4-F44 TaxID=2925842 RepID=UPI001F537E35|nr:aminoglycoside adenylyltransferase family protein [Luteimonas sp. S4-F44]UNK42432.1 aminoglycoside adenylyltransferase family protein [Luteimonas sp. S4-F44]